MSAYDTLRAAVDAPGGMMIPVSRLDLVELLEEFNLLRTGGAAKPASKYSAEFEEAWTLYPSRPGASKAAAYRQWQARLKNGTTALAMIEGTQRYADYCKAERKEGEFIKLPATFYGRDEHYALEWAPARARRPLALVDQNAANNAAAKRLINGQPPDDGMTINA